MSLPSVTYMAIYDRIGLYSGYKDVIEREGTWAIFPAKSLRDHTVLLLASILRDKRNFSACGVMCAIFMTSSLESAKRKKWSRWKWKESVTIDARPNEDVAAISVSSFFSQPDCHQNNRR